MFREAGMKPINHELTEAEKEKVERAFAVLPPLHQKILKAHLQSVSFMDNMPNNALTSPVESSDSTKLYNITFRAGILGETVSEWATKKEYTSFNQSTDSVFTIRVEAGTSDAIQYVLLHEATHVVDAVLSITPHPKTSEALAEPTTFTKNIWSTMNRPVNTFVHPLLEKTRFRTGSAPIDSAADVYKALQQTPFASLYGMAAWFEDLAELEAIYHHTRKMGQPFRILVRKNNVEVVRFEPMNNKRVKARIKQLRIFYKS
ncbi:hypothetical protein GO755_27735 [Spirosoma sp. HMF4905]|uniref:Uncharacterized protein n=2 Tax=Spirosoma arboris TaxID=2682092 RepID=A0A7K1SJ62_9BACT|nr:hypothetical protein [Spirosoma arboris]